MARRNDHIQLANLAEQFLDELEGNVLEVILVPSRDDDCALRGGMIRCVASSNARWYRQFCLLYESSRRRERRKPDTMIKRQWTRRGLSELKEGQCATIYAQRLKKFIRRYARENEMRGGGLVNITMQFYKTHSGQRLLTYALYRGQVFLCYSVCFCGILRAAKMIRERMK